MHLPRQETSQMYPYTCVLYFDEVEAILYVTRLFSSFGWWVGWLFRLVGWLVGCFGWLVSWLGWVGLGFIFNLK